MIYRSPSEVDFRLEDLPAVPSPRRVLLTEPSFFKVDYVINPHMEGNVGQVDQQEARRQWDQLLKAYEDLGIKTVMLPGSARLPDMVFCANQTLPYFLPHTEGARRAQCGVVLSHMHASQRRDEVIYYERFFRSEGYHTEHLPISDVGDFEGMGDALWHAERYLLWGGHGFRTDLSAYEHIADRLDVRVVALALHDPDFYHLDTCLSMLDETSALYYPGAFDEEGLALIRHFFPTLVEAPEDEARNLFACNAHCPDGQHVLLQKGCTETNRRLREAGFESVEIETSEFLKAGGSVFCMKQMFW